MYTAQPCILLIEEQKIARETKRGREIQNTCERERKRERQREREREIEREQLTKLTKWREGGNFSYFRLNKRKR